MSDAIERITLTHLEMPLKEPFRTASGELTVKHAILVTVETPSAVGLGETSPVAQEYGNSHETAEHCWRELAEGLIPRMLGQSISSRERIGALFQGWAGSRVAATGVETACWDVLGQLRREPLAELLGASPEQVERGVESGLTVGLYPTIVELVRSIDAHLSEGYRRVKIKIAPGRDVAFVRAVRQHFGDVPLMVDGNGVYQRSDLDVFRELDTFDLLMIEQPLAADDLEGLAALQKAIATPICLDETAHSLEHAAAAIARGAGRVVNLRLHRLGGFGPAVALHDLCYAQGIGCWVGSTPELGVGLAQSLHLATLPNCKYPTDVAPATRWLAEDFVVPIIEMSSPGTLPVPTRPGLGCLLDPAKVRRYQLRQQEFRASALG